MKVRRFWQSLELQQKDFLTSGTWDMRKRQGSRVPVRLPSHPTVRLQSPHPENHSFLGCWGTPHSAASPPSLAIPSGVLGSLTSWFWTSTAGISQDPFPGPLLSEAPLYTEDLTHSFHDPPQVADSQVGIRPWASL